MDEATEEIQMAQASTSPAHRYLEEPTIKPGLSPCVFLLCQGETKSQDVFTSSPRIAMTENGWNEVQQTEMFLMGPGRLIEPQRLAQIYIGSQKAAQQTWLIFDDKEMTPYLSGCKIVQGEFRCSEWNYGDFEGLSIDEIRMQHDLDWSALTHGFPNGVTLQNIQFLVDSLLKEVVDTHERFFDGSVADDPYTRGDILIVSHQLMISAFLKRWLGLTIDAPFPVMVEPGKCMTLGYKSGAINERVFFPGCGVPVRRADVAVTNGQRAAAPKREATDERSATLRLTESPQQLFSDRPGDVIGTLQQEDIQASVEEDMTMTDTDTIVLAPRLARQPPAAQNPADQVEPNPKFRGGLLVGRWASGKGSAVFGFISKTGYAYYMVQVAEEDQGQAKALLSGSRQCKYEDIELLDEYQGLSRSELFLRVKEFTSS